jgi:chemotaxis protein MotB
MRLKGSDAVKLNSIIVLGLVAATIAASGCSNKKLLAEKDQRITDLEAQVSSLQGDLSAEKARTAKLNSDLETALSDLRAKQQVWLEEKEGLTHITLDGEVTFASGSARLTSEGQKILDRIWDVVGQYPDRTILIEGHTDNVPIAPQFQNRFRSNWELSSARANSVLHYVRKAFNVAPSRIGAVGYGEYRPIATNDTPEGRKLNRRVVITIGSKNTQEKMVP